MKHTDSTSNPPVDIRALVAASAASVPPVGRLLGDYARTWLAAGIELRCARSYRSILRAHLGELAGVDLAHITVPVYRGLLEFLRTKLSRFGKPLSPRTRRNVRILLHAIMEDATDDGLITENPCKPSRRDRHIDRVRDADPSWRPDAVFTRAEIVKLLTDRRIPEKVRVAFALLFFAGIRESELAALVKDGELWPIRNDRAWLWLQKACDRIGIRRRGIHILRATFATIAQEDGANGALIERIGWNSAQGDEGGRVLAGYSRFSWTSLCEAIEQLQLDLRGDAAGGDDVC